MSAGQVLNLGTVLSKGETNVDLPFSLEEDQAEAFQVNPDLFATGRTCVIGSSGCLPENEYFYSKNGVVKVSEVYNGMPSHDGYISDIACRRDNIYKVVLRGDGRGRIEFIASSEHPILVSLPCNRKLNHSGHKYHEHERWITVKELFEKRYRLAFAKLVDSDFINVNEISIGKIEAKLFGYLMSDGTWGKKQPPKFTNNNLSFDEEVITLSQELVSEPKVYSKGRGVDLLLVDNRHSELNKIMQQAEELGISDRNSFGKLQCLQKDELVEFFKGYFNGDGHICFGNHLREIIFYVGIHRRQAVELQFMLWRLGIYSTIHHRVRMAFTIRGCWEVKVCQPSAKLAAQLFRDIKQPEIFDKFISYPDVPILNDLGVPRLCDKNWVKIQKVELIGEETVVGWQSNPDHQIISYGGLVTHNSGKSYTVGVICEELCKNKVPFVIVDTEGEYSGLKEKFNVVWIGDDPKSDIHWNDKIDLKALGRRAPDLPPIVFDISEASRPREKVHEFLLELYREISKRRTPYLIILEEADRFSPQVGDRLPIFDEIARRGRKRGLGLMLCTQRPSLVDKNILSQCSNQLIGKLVIKNDLNSVAQFFSSGRGPPNQLTTLNPGEFFALGGIVPEPEKVKIRARETRHGGMTPKLFKETTPTSSSTEKILHTIQSNSSSETAIQEPEKSEATIAVPELEDTTIAVPKEEETSSLEVPPEISRAGDEGMEAPQFEVEEADSDTESVEEEEEEKHFEPFSSVDSDSSKVVGLAPTIQRESVPGLVKLEKTYKLFGQKENVTDVALVFRPLTQVGVRIRSGLIKKKFDTKYFLLDGMSGKIVEVTDRLTTRSGVEKLLSLGEGHVQILKAMYPDKDLTIIEIAGTANREVEETRRLIKLLEDRRLVRSTKLGRAKGYRRLLDIPRIDLASEPLLKLNELNPSDGFKLSKVKIVEPQVREVVKGMWQGADVDSFRQIYYPIYVAEIILKGRTRHVWIDGRTGNEIEI